MNNVQALKRKFRSQGVSGLALDIDETLSWTVGFWFDLLRDRIGNPENLSTEELVNKYRYSQRVPYWQTAEAQELLDGYRNSDEIQEALPLIDNADTAIREIHEITPIAVYLTTRPDRVIAGTKRWLDKHGFPTANVIARPSEVPPEDSNKWKAAVLESLYPEILGIIDDNPGLVDNLSGGYRGTVYLYNMSEHPRQDIAVIPCAGWPEIIQAVVEDKQAG